MKRFFRFAAIFSIIAGIFTSCKENVESSSYVSHNIVAGCANLSELVKTECDLYNNTHYTPISKEATLENFDDVVKKIENEVFANNDNYKIYTYTEVTLSVFWNDSTIKEVKLQLQPNVDEIIYMAVIITQENEAGAIDKFTEILSKRLTAKGFVSSEPNKYTYYEEFENINKAHSRLLQLENAPILDLLLFRGVISNDLGYDYYQGKVTVAYELVDNTKYQGTEYTNFKNESWMLDLTKTSNGNNRYLNGVIKFILPPTVK